MGDYNRDAFDILGPETSLWTLLQAALNNPKRAFAMRLVPGAVSVGELHSFVAAAAGSPGLALEVVNDLDPTIVRPTSLGQTGHYRPGSDSDAITTGWEDNANGAANFGDVDNPSSTSVFVRNSTALFWGTARALAFSANASGDLAGMRILAVHVGASVFLGRAAQTARQVFVRGILVAGGSSGTFARGPEQTIRSNNRYNNVLLATWELDPFLQQPWLLADVDDFLDPTDDELFGIEARSQAAAEAVRVNNIYIQIDHCAENRMWYSYLNYQPELGWHQQAMTSLLGALSSGTYYWLVVSCPFATSAAQATLPVMLGPPDTPLSTSASGDGEHRGIYELALAYAGGVPETVPAIQPGFFPALLGSSGTIHSQSQAYAGLDRIALNSDSAANIGQQMTTDGSTHAFGGVALSVGWEGGSPPDAPLRIEVRHGSGAISGGGTLLARAVINPEQAPTPLTFVRQDFDAGAATAPASTQLFVLCSSDATPGRGWVVFRGDTRSDFLQETPTTTLNEVEQASFGPSGGTGQTDSYVEAGSALDRYDLLVMLIGAPSPPEDVVATAHAAETTERAAWEACDPTTTPPYIEVTWSPASSPLGSDFGAVVVARRERLTPTRPWVERMRRSPASGETPATVEQNDTYYRDYDVAMGRQYEYAVWNEDALGRRSSIEFTTAVATAPTGSDAWLASSREPWASSRIHTDLGLEGGEAEPTTAVETLGGGTLLRTGAQPPPRQYQLRWLDRDVASERVLRRIRTLSLLGVPATLLRPRGEAIIGVPSFPGSQQGGSRTTNYGATFYVGGRVEDQLVSEPNGPAEIILDGTDGVGSVADHSDLDPTTNPFTIVLAARLGASGGSDYLLSKGQDGTDDGIWLRTTGNAGELEVEVEGASTSVTAAATDASLFSPSRLVVLTLDYDQATLRLFVDDETTARDTAAGVAGSITNGRAVLLGADNDGSDGGADFAGIAVRALQWHGGILDDDVRIENARYLLGHFDARPAPVDRLFFDAADSRSWGALEARLTNLALAPTPHLLELSDGWSRRGRPWDLVLLDPWD